MSAPLILAIESATSCVGCALGTVDGVLAATHTVQARRHAESLAPQIQSVLAEAGRNVRDIELVAVDVGPGLYTGLRVGITTARAMAHTLGVPMVAVTSLEAVAWQAGADVTVAIDARRGEVFHETFTAGVGSGPAVGPPLDAVAPGRTVVGDGAEVYESQMLESGAMVDHAVTGYPVPESILALAAGRAHEACDPVGIQPLYLRAPDAVAKFGTA
ncbi:MAG: tRNA (adenosine(37)-N6)-threonylcarbamoyltransferase complex dimerization subunit type 1 TsaB [Acidimicrobiales bacterium]|nr:MAG: tRNA (adenosine(37)-N6)-threonylcarbamoyltransferase complex dimerization subunit type 1 TsaB [Acidimicrobiales bacterium]